MDKSPNQENAQMLKLPINPNAHHLKAESEVVLLTATAKVPNRNVAPMDVI